MLKSLIEVVLKKLSDVLVRGEGGGGAFESALPPPEPAVSRCEPPASGITSDARVAANQCSGSKSKRATAARGGRRQGTRW